MNYEDLLRVRLEANIQFSQAPFPRAFCLLGSKVLLKYLIHNTEVK